VRPSPRVRFIAKAALVILVLLVLAGKVGPGSADDPARPAGTHQEVIIR
jgi:hypothetical protein